MLNGKTVAVVVPAYNEEKQIGRVIETMPDFVDRIVIVNDCSRDGTAQVVSEYLKKDNKGCVLENALEKTIQRTTYNYAEVVVHEMAQKEASFYTPAKTENKEPEKERTILINHIQNGGVGAAIATGYKWARDYQIDCTAVMAGDGQMDPAELESICSPVITENIDYVKGNRLIHKSAWLVIPKIRFFGNSILSALTKLASGYWHVSDTQTGYTAISLTALQSIKIYDIYKSYGMPNDLLVKLNVAYCSLKEVEIKPIYNVGEQSKMKISTVIPKVSWLLLKLFFKRLWTKYLFRDFHPLFLLYHLGLVLFVASMPYLYKIIYLTITQVRVVSEATILAFIFLFISAFQSILFAMWMDIQDNERLYR